jgi:hypothetical protein
MNGKKSGDPASNGKPEKENPQLDNPPTFDPIYFTRNPPLEITVGVVTDHYCEDEVFLVMKPRSYSEKRGDNNE